MSAALRQRPKSGAAGAGGWLASAWGMLLAVTLALLLPLGAWAQQPLPPGTYGFIDTVEYDATKSMVRITGWCYDSQNQRLPKDFLVRVGDAEKRIAVPERKTRPSVGVHFQDGDRIALEFTLELRYPRYLAGGEQPVSVIARFEDGGRFDVQASSPAAGKVQGPDTPGRHWVIAAAVAGAIALLLLPGSGGLQARLGTWVGGHRRAVAGGIAGIFLVLVGIGATGSSLELLLGRTDQGPHPFLSPDSAMTHVAGQPRGVRSDDWMVVTASALAQANHEPPFPVINRHLGLDGQNMMVIGMTGVPVWHVSALARPATWGFFALPLDKALAWYWYFPFFACLLALWWLLEVLAPGRPGRNLALSAVFCVAPYAAGWSHWPLYVVFFPSGALAATLLMLRHRAGPRLWGLALALGWFLAGFALVLYPPWQITVATLYALVLAAWLADNRRQIAWGRLTPLAFALAVAVMAALLYFWWHDAREAISAMRNTVYPGQRAALRGGDLSILVLLRGFGNADTLSNLQNSVFNESEFGSYLLLLLAIWFLCLQQARSRGPHRWVVAACALFTVFTVVFGVWGIPLALSKAMFWHYVSSSRIDLALGLACLLVLACLPAPAAAPRRTAPVVLGLLSAAVAALAMAGIPEDFHPGLSATLLASMAVAVGLMAYWLVQGKVAHSIALTAVVYVAATVDFNPVALAPSHVALNETVQRYVTGPAGADGKATPRRVLALLPSTSNAMALAAAGVPMVNGVFYYPQPSVWRGMHLPAGEQDTVNRYQHLTFVQETMPAPAAYRVVNPTPDTVRVLVDPRRFDFAQAGAQVVVGNAGIFELGENPRLRLLGKHEGWAWYEVAAAAP
ncbi:hypothetical protein PMI14_02965 [Acidovorax sp. CF316]|uniref:DUF7657 domain-containing protein n=1 Tax=Acidovorax sp. CF316 TaxID=1144317 RepID=UPI00026BBF54|nr:hypothetical protein [Acidovorax sp. CF316]EJE52354.1 hypothetical protein PMI14_02965 [Acidovorax sp. CF316]